MFTHSVGSLPSTPDMTDGTVMSNNDSPPAGGGGQNNRVREIRCLHHQSQEGKPG